MNNQTRFRRLIVELNNLSDTKFHPFNLNTCTNQTLASTRHTVTVPALYLSLPVPIDFLPSKSPFSLSHMY